MKTKTKKVTAMEKKANKATTTKMARELNAKKKNNTMEMKAKNKKSSENLC